MCFSCGYDIPSWHTSATCDNSKPGHQTGCTRANAEQYTSIGNYVIRMEIHKVKLPVNSGIRQAWQGGAAATLELACNVNPTVNVYSSLYPTHIYDKHTNFSPMLQEEYDDEDTVWTSNRWSTVKTEKSTITPVDNNSDKWCSYEKYIPLHTWTLQVNRMPAQHKIVQTNNIGTSLQQVLASFQKKWKRRFNMPSKIQEIPYIFWYKELP